MNLNLYETVVSIIGYLPNEMHFVYAIGVIFIYFVIITCAISPFILLFRFLDK